MQAFLNLTKIYLSLLRNSFSGARNALFCLTFFLLPAISLAQLYQSTIGDPLVLGQFRHAKGIVLDASGNIFVGDAVSNTITKFNSSGTAILQWGAPGSGNGQFNFGGNNNFFVGFAIDGSGNLYVTDFGNEYVSSSIYGNTRRTV